MALLLLCIATSTCPAEDSVVEPDDTAQQLHERMQDIGDQVDDHVTQLDAIEHYLSDRLLVQAGKAPVGWVQPPVSAYEEPGAPDSLIPASQPATDAAPAAPVPATDTSWSYVGPTQ